MLNPASVDALKDELVKISLAKNAGDVIKFTRPLTSRVKDVVQKVTPKQKKPAKVIKPDFQNPDTVRAALKSSKREAAQKQWAREQKQWAAESASDRAASLKEKSDKLLTRPGVLALGAASGAGVGALRGAMHGPELRGEVRKKKKKGEPVSSVEEFIVNHPAATGAGVVGAGVPASFIGERFGGLPGMLAGAAAPALGLYAAHRLTKPKKSEG